jgi:hypothetical protein
MNGGSVFGDTFQNITFFESITGTGNGSFYTHHLPMAHLMHVLPLITWVC